VGVLKMSPLQSCESYRRGSPTCRLRPNGTMSPSAVSASAHSAIRASMTWSDPGSGKVGAARVLHLALSRPIRVVARSARRRGRSYSHHFPARPFVRPPAVTATCSSRYSERHSGGSGGPSLDNSRQLPDVRGFIANRQRKRRDTAAVRVLHRSSISRGVAGRIRPWLLDSNDSPTPSITR
jgi:hypothetical protein